MKSTNYFLILISFAVLASCAHRVANVPPNIQFFKLVDMNNPDKVIALEYWQEFTDFTYLYADIVIRDEHFEIFQRIKFDRESKVTEVENLFKNKGRKLIAGAVRVNDQSVVLNDLYIGKERKTVLRFKGAILHPARLDKYIAGQSFESLASTEFGFVDWRSAKPFIDTFKINRLSENSYAMPMGVSKKFTLELENNKFNTLHLYFYDLSGYPDAILKKSSLREFNETQNFSFDFESTQSLMNDF